MIVESTKEDGAVVLRIAAANLDRSNAGEFRALAAEAVAASEGRVTVDCGELQFVDSSGVGALLHLSQVLPEERRPVRLKSVAGPVMAVLELVRVHRMFEIGSAT